MFCCPRCPLPLVTIEVNEVELDYCAEGHGLWFDAGEIQSLLGVEEPFAETKSHARAASRCPRCRARMRIWTVDQSTGAVSSSRGSLELDVCPAGDGVWFDDGELAHFVSLWNNVGLEDAAPGLSKALRRLGTTIGGSR